MTAQRTLLVVAALGALALIFLLPLLFQETDAANVPPVELIREPVDPTPTATPEPEPEAEAAPPPVAAPPPPANDDDDGGDDDRDDDDP